MRKIGLQLIEEKQRDIAAEKASGGGTVLEQKGKVPRAMLSVFITYPPRLGHDRDLLSLMMRSNMSTTTPPEQRLSVDQMLQQIPTFLLAGQDPFTDLTPETYTSYRRS